MTTTTNAPAMPERAECQSIIEAIARGGDAADLTFTLQAICLELMELRVEARNIIKVLQGQGIGFLPNDPSDGSNGFVDRWDGFASRRP